MFLILLLLFCSAATAAVHPPIDGVDRSGFYDHMRQEFDKRRLFVGIVDTVSAASYNVPPVVLPNTVSIGLQPDDADSHPYGFVSRRLAEALRCFDASDAEFEHDGSEPEYVLSINAEKAQAITQALTGDAMALLRNVAVQAGMTREEASNIEFIECWFIRAPEIMQIKVAMGPRHGPRLRSGWIVERYPLGKFHMTPEPLNLTFYQSPVYLTNYSYVDGRSGSIIDVVAEEDETGKRIWSPTGRPAFARVNVSIVEVQDITNFTLFRETETGVLITTMAPILTLAYNISDQGIEERIALDGHHYYVTCDWKQGNRPISHRIRWSESPLNHTVVRTNYGVEMSLVGANNDLSFYCKSKRATPTGIPELFQLDYVESSESVVVPSRERNVTIRTLKDIKEAEKEWIGRRLEDIEENGVNATKLGGAMYDSELKEYVPWTPKPPSVVVTQPLPADIQKEHEQAPLDDLIFLLIVVAVLAVLTVVCAAACVRRRARKSRKPVVQSSDGQEGEDRRRKDSHAHAADAARQNEETAEQKDEEVEDPQPATAPTRTSSFKKTGDEAPTRSNSKKRITFAPRQPSVKTEDLVKMITEEALPSRIDAMVEAGPDGEEEDEKPQVQPAAPAAMVIDETAATSN